MNVGNIVNLVSISKMAQKTGNAFRGGYTKLPNIQLGEKAFTTATKIGQFISNPVGNRIVLAGTGILLQPTIDYYNKKVDRKTREVSAIRTASKIIAGTGVGLAVRGGCMALTKNMKYIPEIIKNNPDKINNYRTAVSTIAAMAIMTITNFLLDAPLTTKLSNKWLEKREQKEQKEQQEVKA